MSVVIESEAPLLDGHSGVRKNVRKAIETTTILPSDVDADRIRADNIREVAYFAPMLMAANALSSSAVVQIAWDEIDHGLLLAWLALIWFLVARSLYRWIQNAGTEKKRVSSRVDGRGVFWGGLQGLSWAILPTAFFVGSSPGLQTVIVAVMMFMTCGNAMGLIRLPRAAFAHAGIMLSSLVFALLAEGGAGYGFLAALCIGYAAVGYLGIIHYSRAANEYSVAQQNLEHQQELITLLLKDFENGTGDWLWETDPRGYLAHVSESFTRICGIEARLLVGRKLTELNFGDDRREWRDLKIQFAGRQQIENFVVPVRIKGEERWWALSAQPRFDDANNFQGYRGVGTDVTAQRQTEIALEEAKNAAESANTAKSKFLAVLSHELRSPLNAVIGFSEIIAEPELGKVPVAKYAEYAREIRDSSRHLLSIIDDLLDIARIESSSIEITQESICAEAMFDTVTRSLAPLAEKRGVTLACQQSNVETMLLADPRLVRQILTNLVTNAIKFTPSGGEVTIGSDLVHNGSVVLWVRDTGIGIAPENVEKIFEPFTQIEGALNRSFEGVGLGLSIAMHLARAHGGDLTVESELGKGTTVRFTVPSWRMTSVRRRVA
jgi:PAS domain S-box-containing protein